MTLYHVTTLKKYKQYEASKCIKSPVRGFNTLIAAMAWAMNTGRTMILATKCDNLYKLPDHHNKFGDAYWNDGDVTTYTCIYSTH